MRIPGVLLAGDGARLHAKPKASTQDRGGRAGIGDGIRTRKRSVRRVRRPSSSGRRMNAQLAANPAIAGIIFPAAFRLAASLLDGLSGLLPGPGGGNLLLDRLLVGVED